MQPRLDDVQDRALWWPLELHERSVIVGRESFLLLRQDLVETFDQFVSAFQGASKVSELVLEVL